MPTLIEVPDEDYAAQKRGVAARAQKFTVTGSAGIRDCVSREIVAPGGVVRLDPEVKGNVLLVRAGAVTPVESGKAKADTKG